MTCVSKDGDAVNPCNSRPIYLLLVLNHSTETVPRSVTDDLIKAMVEKKISILVMMDMSKAFDSINHDMLLFKLRSLCVSPSALEWFKSYLKARNQYVRIGVWFAFSPS